MIRIPKLLVPLLLLLASPTAMCQSRPEPTARQVADRSLPSVVLLVFETDRPNGGKLGSGFFVGPDIIATNFHVVDGTKSGYAKLPGSPAKYDVVGLVAVDSPRDLALVKIKGVKGKPLPLGDSKAVGVGDDVYAIGNPEGLEGTFSTGMVSSVRKRGDDSLIQITAPISAGSSGGPVLNSTGEVIGVAMGSMRGGEALNFAIPASYLKSLIANQKSVQPLESDERPAAISEVLQPPPATGSGLPLADRRAPKASDSPSLTTSDVAIARSRAYWKEGAITQIHFFSEPLKPRSKPQFDITFGGDECSFKVSTSYRQGQGRTADGLGLVDYMDLRMDCGRDGAFFLTATTNRIGLNLSPGVYEHARNPRIDNIKAPGFDISGSWSCPNPSNITFEIHEIQFAASNKRDVELSSLGLEFREDCGPALGTVRGTVYFNYAK